MAHIYIAFVDTPGFFAALIRKFLKQRYVHVVIAADAMLTEAYSVGRRTPAIPFFSGFEREDKNKILHTFPTAFYRSVNICSHYGVHVLERFSESEYGGYSSFCPNDVNAFPCGGSHSVSR